jgi:tetratricopeptide (TPR) repeat protein
MKLTRTGVTLLALLIACSMGSFAQDKPAAPPAPAASSETAATSSAATPGAQKAPDQAAAYYHFAMAHIYEEMVSMYGLSEYANKAIEEYRLAIDNDPTSEYLNAGLAELYARTGRIKDAVMEAQDILKRDGNNLEAHRLLGRIYLRSLGDMQSGTQSQEVLKLAIEQYEQIVKLDPKSVEDRLLLGRLYRLNNDLVKAENEFKTAVKIQPDSEEAVTALSILYNEEGDTSRALEVLNSFPEAARSSKLYSALGYTYEQNKAYKKAIDAYQKSVDLDHDNLDSVRGLAQNLLNDGQTDAALAQFKVIVEADPSDAQTYMRIAEIYRRAGKYDEAMDSLKKASAVVPESLELKFNIAVVDQAQGKYDEAITILNQLLQKTEHSNGEYDTSDKNNRAIFLERLGTVYREANKPQLSVDTFRRMLDLGDDNAIRGYQEIIETYRDNKQWQLATTTAEEAAKKFPNDRPMQMVAASQRADLGESGPAIAQVKLMLKGTAEDRDVYIALAQMYSRIKDWPQAEASVNKAMELSTKPEDKEYTTFVAGSIYERQKKYDLAEQSFQKVIAMDPKNAQALNYLGYMLADRGIRLDDASGYIRRAIALDPQNGAYLDSLGWVYYRQGNYELAEDNLRRASEKIGSDPTVQAHLGDLYQKTGRLKLATAHWQRALDEWNKTVPAEVDTEEVAKVQKDLESAKVKLAKQQTTGKE